MNPRQASKDHPAEQDVLLEGTTSDKGKYLAPCTNLYYCVTTDHKLAVASSDFLYNSEIRNTLLGGVRYMFSCMVTWHIDQPLLQHHHAVSRLKSSKTKTRGTDVDSVDCSGTQES